MHHPGPPRFIEIGDTIQLAPRNPDPNKTFSWTVLEQPANSDLNVSGDPVIELSPEVPGTYRFELQGPETTYPVTVRAFPNERDPTTLELPSDQRPLEGADIHRILMGLDAEARFADYVSFATPGRPRIELNATLEASEMIISGDAKSSPDSDYSDEDVTVEFLVDDRDAPLSEVTEEGDRIRIPREAIPSVLRIHAVAVAERPSVATQIRIERDGDDIAISYPDDPPAWAEEAIIYEITPRRFAASAEAEADYTTTFEDLKRRVPYLESLGIDCLWLMPTLETRTDSGYEVTDYFSIAEDLGSRSEYQSFIDRCHQAGIKVIFDLVINHSSVDHHFFQLSAADVDSYRDWYIWDEDGEYEYYFNWTHLPNFNYRNLAVRRYLLDVVEEWADVVDGFRCDVAFGTPHGFWKEVRSHIKDEHPDFLLLDETLPRDAAYAEGEFDIHHDTTLYHTLSSIAEGDRPASALLDAAQAWQQEGFPNRALHLRYIENHDMPRFAEKYGIEAVRPAVAAIMALPGTPMIFYGQERGIQESGWPQAPMKWRDGNNELTEYHRQLIAARNEHEALQAGSLEQVTWTAKGEHTVAFARETDTERLLVLLNFGESATSITIDEEVERRELVTGVELECHDTSEGVCIQVEDVAVLRGER